MKKLKDNFPLNKINKKSNEENKLMQKEDKKILNNNKNIFIKIFDFNNNKQKLINDNNNTNNNNNLNDIIIKKNKQLIIKENYIENNNQSDESDDDVNNNNIFNFINNKNNLNNNSSHLFEFLYNTNNNNNNKETNPFFEQIKIKNNDNYYSGFLFYHEYFFRFSPDRNIIENFNKNCSVQLNYYNFGLFNIHKIKKLGDDLYSIKTKDKRKIIFKSSQSLINKINNIFILKKEFEYLNYAFFFKNDILNKKIIYEKDGWNLFNTEKEFSRQKIPLDQFKLSKINYNYSLCPTYPKLFYIPIKFSEKNLSNVAKFRDKNRLPVLVYYFKKSNTSIWRSSQCKGELIKSNKYDINYINLINTYNKMIIYDARPYISAITNKYVKGMGIEKKENYKSISNIFYCNIENIHVVNNSYKSIFKDLINNKNNLYNKKFLSEFENTNWLNYISDILKASIEISNSLFSNNILIHCSDGWDRTPQLCSLVQIIIDPYFRTIEGFAVLIEKDWISFGHNFLKRNGGNQNFAKKKKISPIFIQFLDCVYQILNQFPTSFEFNQNLLIFITEELFNNKFGSFLFNCERDLNWAKAKEKTISIWSEILKNKEKYVNYLYNKNYKNYLNVKYQICYLKIWKEFFFKYDKIGYTYNNNKYFNINENIEDIINKKNDAIKDLINVIFLNKCQIMLKPETLDFFKLNDNNFNNNNNIYNNNINNNNINNNINNNNNK